jgi:hypothetical protein
MEDVLYSYVKVLENDDDDETKGKESVEVFMINSLKYFNFSWN